MENKGQKEIIVISAVNLFIGGPLTILQECLSFLENNENIQNRFLVMVLVHDRQQFGRYKNIEFIERKKSRESWLYRLYYEYAGFKKMFRKQSIYLWFSLHDITPSVKAKRKAVYCHNPSPFIKVSKEMAQFDKGFFMFSLFYKYLYAINIRKNNYIVVQQQWLREEFTKMFSVSSNRIIVAYPNISVQPTIDNNKNTIDEITFLYPAIPRVFKNFEIIIKATEIVKQRKIKPFKVLFTIDGTENKYAVHIKKIVQNIEQIRLIGLQNKQEMNALYEASSCLLFPSKLETWGLPITEAKTYRKPMLVADLPYARETVNAYEEVSFFNAGNAQELANLMIAFLEGSLVFTGNKSILPAEPFSKNWAETFDFLLYSKK